MSIEDPKLDEIATFDPNVWYQISEVRVDKASQPLSHNLNYEDDPPGFKVFPSDKNYWQFLPVDDGADNRWFLRSQKTGTDFHLSACINPDEEHPDKTGLCMLRADPEADEQIWETTKWNDGTGGVRFINVGNGTNYYLDCHKGSPPFMNDDIDTSEYKPAQRWLMSSVSDVDEPSFQVGDGQATMTGVDTGPTSDVEPPSEEAELGDEGGSGLSTGASAGIGVGVGVAVIAVLVAAFFLLRRRKHNKAQGEEAAAAAAIQSYHAGGGEDAGGKYQKVGEASANPVAIPVAEAPAEDKVIREMEGLTPISPQTAPMELDSTEMSGPRRS